MKLLVDMNLSPRWVDLLTRSQLAAVHWSSGGRPQSLDGEIMAYAAKHGYVVLTNDLDFGTILAVKHREIVSALRQLEEQLQEEALVNIEPSRTRVRLLPLVIAK